MNKRTSTFVGSILLAAILLAGCTAPLTGAMMASSTPAPAPVPGQLTVVDARARPAPLAGGTGAVFLTVLNGLAEDMQLESANSPAANVVELHETVEEDGVMRMIPHPEGFPVPAGGSLEMKPGGKHVMLIDIVQPLDAGDSVELTLAFGNGETIALTVPVVDLAGAMSGEMSGEMSIEMQHDADAASGESHDHGDMGGGSTEEGHEHGPEMAPEMSADVATLIEQLPVGEIHALDELLATGKSDDESVATVAALTKALDDPAWPAALQPQLAAIRQLAESLRSALESDDLAAAAPLATQLHDLLHELEHGAGH